MLTLGMYSNTHFLVWIMTEKNGIVICAMNANRLQRENSAGMPHVQGFHEVFTGWLILSIWNFDSGYIL